MTAFRVYGPERPGRLREWPLPLHRAGEPRRRRAPLAEPEPRDPLKTLGLNIKLGGHPTTSGSIDAVPRPSQERYGRAAGTLALFLVIAAAVFFIPPHIPWAAGALLVGLFLSFRQLRSEYTVERFEGACPRCGAPLPVKQGEQIRFPLKLTCFECHHEPVVQPSDA